MRETGLGIESKAIVRVGGAVAALVQDVPADRHHRDAVLSRALRRISGRTDLELDRRPSGRPALKPPYPELAVSLASRRGLALVGLAPSGRVGVDMEASSLDAHCDVARLARDHFADAEAAAIAGLRGEDAADLFLRLWTVKEAALKITGRGVFDGLERPNAAACLNELSVDCQVVALSLPEVPAVYAAVRRLALAPGEGLYCALAWAPSAFEQQE